MVKWDKCRPFCFGTNNHCAKKIHQNKTILAIAIKIVLKCTTTNALIQEQRMGLKNSFGLLQSEVSQVMSIWKKSSQNGFMEMRNFRERAVGLNPVSSSPYWTKWVTNYIK
jgi:hypothetical protein